MNQKTRDVIRRQTVRLRLMTEPGGWCNSMERLGASAREATKALKKLQPYLVDAHARP